jgi:hypothetical protein
MKNHFREARTFFCTQGHNVLTTTERSPECGACGQPMTTDPTSFDDAIEIIEQRGIREAEAKASIGTPGKGRAVARPTPSP